MESVTTTMQTDPISDLLTRIRNAAKARHARVDVPTSLLKVEVARILKEEGYISTYKLIDENKTRKTLRLFLKYTPDKRSVITDLKRISKPGSRRYLAYSEIRPVVGGMGVSIMTTPKGVMTGRAARKSRVGGEVLCEVW
jgi:small subunit ribosomal protein S8